MALSKSQRFINDLNAEAALPPPVAPIAPVDPLSAAHASIRLEGRSGIARTFVNMIVPDPQNPRKAKNIDVEDIDNLGGSMKADKQLQPIVVYWRHDLQKWMIICGERRWMAAQQAGIEMIACRFLFEDPGRAVRLKMQGAENLQRVGFTDTERAELFRDLMKEWGWNQPELAKEMRISQSTVSRALALLEEPKEMHGAFISGETDEQEDKPEPDQNAPPRSDLNDPKEMHGAFISPRKPKKKKGKRGPKPGKVHKFKTSNGCTITMCFQQRPTESDINAALQELLDERQGKRQAA